MTRMLLVLALTFGGSLFAADSPATLLTILGKPIFADDLSKGMGPGWTKAKGKWDTDGAAARGAELKSDMHGAVARHDAKFKDGVIAFDFKLDGTKGTSLSLNAKGHVCRVQISATRFSVNKDDQDGKNGPDKGELLKAIATEIKPAEWHTLVVEFRGPDMLATLDDKHHAFGTHAAIDKEKTNLGFTSAGEFVSFRNLKVFEASANPEWEKSKEKIVGKK